MSSCTSVIPMAFACNCRLPIMRDVRRYSPHGPDSAGGHSFLICFFGEVARICSRVVTLSTEEMDGRLCLRSFSRMNEKKYRALSRSNRVRHVRSHGSVRLASELSWKQF